MRHFAARCNFAIVDNGLERVLSGVIRDDIFTFLSYPDITLHVFPIGQQLIELTDHGSLMLLIITITQLEDSFLEVIQLGHLGVVGSLLPGRGTITYRSMQGAAEGAILAHNEMLESHQIAEEVEEGLGGHARTW